MQIIKLVVKGYKNLNDLTIEFNGNNTTVLIGNNGTGKSNVIEAISAVFAGLFNERVFPVFKFLIEYKISGQKVLVNNLASDISYKVNGGNVEKLEREHLPTQVIASYSGEDDRLWRMYYEPFYMSYIHNLRGAGALEQPLIYINKFYWNIALLTLFFYDFEQFSDIKAFCEDTLKIQKIEEITFSYEISTLERWEKTPNQVTAFVQAINPERHREDSLSLELLKDRLELLISQEKEFFTYLAAASMPKGDKLITNIKITFNGDLTTDVLSEGEKKLILMKFILEVVGDENSLILLDEPDSHIHISRKRDLQDQLDSYENRNNIITTHSPTLMHCFEDQQIRMLENKGKDGIKVEDLSKKDSILSLTDGIWSYEEQTIFLSTNKDILLVEGKTDVRNIEVALKKLEDNYPDLSLELFPFNGADGLLQILDKFEPKDGQTIIAILDRDKAGADAVKDIFPEEEKGKSDTRKRFTYLKKGNVYVAMLPVKKYYRGDKKSFIIEDYFKLSKIKQLVYPKDCKSFATIGNKENIKKVLAKTCADFDKGEFNGFKALFDLITKIKEENIL